MDKAENYVVEGGLKNPILFEAVIREKTLQAIEKSLKKELPQLEHHFSNWIKSIGDTYKLTDESMISSIKEGLNDVIVFNEGSLYFNPEKINISIKVDRGKEVPKNKRIRKVDLRDYSKLKQDTNVK